MIPGIWTESEFKNNTKSSSVFGKRKPLLKAIDSALGVAHSVLPDKHMAHVVLVERACSAWLVAHPDTSAVPTTGKKTSNRRRGIEALLAKINTFKANYKGYHISPTEQLLRSQITSQYETSTKVLNIAPGDKDPRQIKDRAAFHQELLARTAKRAKDLGHEDEDLNTEQIGYLAAHSALKLDAIIDPKKREKCRVEAMRILCAMLSKNRALALQFEASGVEVVVVPADRPMTDLPEFASLHDVAISQTGGTARVWNETRGVGGLVVDLPTGVKKVYVAVTEENLLGTGVGVAVSAVGGGCYSALYSTTSHEFAHGLHIYSLTPQQKLTITACFNRKKKVSVDTTTSVLTITDSSVMGTQMALDTVFNAKWADGPRRMLTVSPVPKRYWVLKNGTYVMNPLAPTTHFQFSSPNALQDCYSAFDEREYFAQLVNAYLGANGGSDPYTGRLRNNGALWIRTNEEPAMVQLLDELFSAGASNHFGQSTTPDTNVDDGVDEPTVRDFIAQRVHQIKMAKILNPLLAKRRLAMGYTDDEDDDDL